MSFIEKKAYAKINLVLDVLNKRNDGYHELAGIMHTVDLFDNIGIMPVFGNLITVECNENLPENNTAKKAAIAFFELLGKSYGVKIQIEKHIPSQAGLGGASADAAAVLYGLQTLFGSISNDALYRIGKRVGADVPFCLFGGCAFAGGIGEKLDRLPAQNLNIVLVKDTGGISTPELFNLYDIKNSDTSKTTDTRLISAINACKETNTEMLCKNMYNALEPCAFSMLPELKSVKRKVESTGARATIMTGSGSVIYGVYPTWEDALKAEDNLKQQGLCFVKAVTTKIT